MTHSLSAPDPTGPDQHVKLTALTVHVASAMSWGRPWRRRSLSLSSPRELTFQGGRLPLPPLLSWLPLLSGGGILDVWPAISGVPKRPEDDEVVSAWGVEPPRQEVTFDELPEREAPVAVSEMGPEIEPAADAVAVSVEQDMPSPETVVRQPVIEVFAEPLQEPLMGSVQEPEAQAPELVAVRENAIASAPFTQEPAEQSAPEVTATSVQPQMDSPAVAEEFSLEPMIASLEDALALLAAGNAVQDDAPTVQVEPIAAASPVQSTSAPLADEASQADDSIPEAAVLQGLFIQKETEMTEMRDESIEAHAQSTVPITSVELQEVAATLSVPQLDADPDDVLSDVQSTLNSLAGMAQGLTQQKQATGRLQEELEEWNVQLQERERLASDKEERLQQLENHLKEAKTNLDRMAAENNRLLAERSEALKELAQTVDLRDRATIKRAESIQLEQQRIDEQAAGLRQRASELDERESGLKRKNEELSVRLKQLQSAKDKFSTIVKSFNETVQFNSTLSAISKTVNE